MMHSPLPVPSRPSWKVREQCVRLHNRDLSVELCAVPLNRQERRPECNPPAHRERPAAGRSHASQAPPASHSGSGRRNTCGFSCSLNSPSLAYCANTSGVFTADNRKGELTMKKRYWRDAGWFALGTFFGGWVLGLFGRLLGRA